MKEPLGTRYVPGYDLFKLIVAIILTIILIVMLLRESRRSAPLALETPLPTATLQPSITSTTTSTVVPTVTLTTAPTIEPTATSTIEPTITPAATVPTATPTQKAEESITATPVAEVSPTETPFPPSDPNGCPSNPTRIQTGVTVRVLDWLNFRTGPGLHFDIQRTNRPGTEMEVIGGPVCTTKGDNPPRAYLWWNVRMDDGREGWSAEAPLNFPNYFLEPVR